MDVCLYFSPLVSTTVDILFSFFPSLFFFSLFFPFWWWWVRGVEGAWGPAQGMTGEMQGTWGKGQGPGMWWPCHHHTTWSSLRLPRVTSHLWLLMSPLSLCPPPFSLPPTLSPSLPPTSLLSFPLLSSPSPPPCASQSHHNSSLFGTSLGLNEKIPPSPSFCLRYFQTLQ